MPVSEGPELTHVGIDRAARDVAEDDVELAGRKHRDRKVRDAGRAGHNQQLRATHAAQTSDRVAGPVSDDDPRTVLSAGI
jgi:hypothetical protein